MTEQLFELQEKYKKNPDETLRKEIIEEIKKTSEDIFDFDNLPPVKHRWVDRGEVMSCEGANHPSHRHFKFKR